LVIGTQTPRVEVVTGRIKANITTRIALMTASQIDSRVILDESGAEQLIGHGDMLFMDPASKGLLRLQGFYC
jgi:DNA segregation ATPase FtsK/SpoIIIE, S-DNA-T family